MTQGYDTTRGASSSSSLTVHSPLFSAFTAATLSCVPGASRYSSSPENAEKLIGFAAHPSGFAIAMCYLVPAAEYDEAGAVTDPETGLTFGYLRYTETQSNRVFVTVECLYGYKRALPDGIKRIVKP